MMYQIECEFFSVHMIVFNEIPFDNNETVLLNKMNCTS